MIIAITMRMTMTMLIITFLYRDAAVLLGLVLFLSIYAVTKGIKHVDLCTHKAKLTTMHIKGNVAELKYSYTEHLNITLVSFFWQVSVSPFLSILFTSSLLCFLFIHTFFLPSFCALFPSVSLVCAFCPPPPPLVFLLLSSASLFLCPERHKNDCQVYF